jgi:cell division protein ZapA
MAQVMVTIAGKVYRMACGDGEEAHLERLAGIFDARIVELHKAFGEIGDMRLHVMAALTVLDELEETKKRVSGLEREAASLRDALGAGSDRAGALEARTAEAFAHAAERIERIARGLSPQSSLQTA